MANGDAALAKLENNNILFFPKDLCAVEKYYKFCDECLLKFLYSYSVILCAQ